MAAATSVPSPGSPVIGVIDGKFESGYLVTVTVGSEKLKGVLYQALQNLSHNVPQNQSISTNNNNNNTFTTSGVLRRRRRKKSEMKKRDPAHPKPNRSGYNFFFAEQHARLKPLYLGKDREISRMIGELWTKMNETEKSFYQDKAVKDKERYKIEMEDYRERLRTGQIISNAVPIQQRPLELLDVNMVETSEKIETEVGEFQTLETDISSSKSSKSDSEDKTEDKEDSDMETSPGLEVGAENMPTKISAEDEEGLVMKRVDKVGDESSENSGGAIMAETMTESVPLQEKGSMPCEGKGPLPSEPRDSVSSEAKASVHAESY
ncbi:hypothetical protein U1Q18_030743 [Sarracenia purpurea var. burkii]